MNLIRRILWTISLYREANRGANRAYWTAMPLGRITWSTAWLAAGSIVTRERKRVLDTRCMLSEIDISGSIVK